jgi:hypothetical protein
LKKAKIIKTSRKHKDEGKYRQRRKRVDQKEGKRHGERVRRGGKAE